MEPTDNDAPDSIEAQGPTPEQLAQWDAEAEVYRQKDDAKLLVDLSTAMDHLTHLTNTQTVTGDIWAAIVIVARRVRNREEARA